MEQEIWQDIPEFEKCYVISNNGVVKSVPRYVRCGKNGTGIRLVVGKAMRPYLGTDGYLYVLLSKDNNTKHLAIHRLVATVFISNPENKREVNHINANRIDNRLQNLEWVTPKENIQHSINIGNNTQCLPGENNPASKLNSRQVLQIRNESGTHDALALKYNVSRRTIGFIKRRERWAHL